MNVGLASGFQCSSYLRYKKKKVQQRREALQNISGLTLRKSETQKTGILLDFSQTKLQVVAQSR